MPYNTVQSYSDKSASVRSVDYKDVKQGAGGGGAGSSSATANNLPGSGRADAPSGALKVEKIRSQIGSTAGASSSTFHIYRHARTREMERLKSMTEAERNAEQDREYKAKRDLEKREAEERTAKRRKKRQRQKEAKNKKKFLTAAGILSSKDGEEDPVDESEFVYQNPGGEQTAGGPDTVSSETAESGPHNSSDDEEGPRQLGS